MPPSLSLNPGELHNLWRNVMQEGAVVDAAHVRGAVRRVVGCGQGGGGLLPWFLDSSFFWCQVTFPCFRTDWHCLPAARRVFTHLPSSFVQLLNTSPAKRSAEPLILKFSTVENSSCIFLRILSNFRANILRLIVACLLSLQVSG